MNALDYISRFENDCLDLYKTLGSEANDTERKELFALLADSRQRHLDKLDQLKATIWNDAIDSELIDRAAQVLNSCRQTLLAPDIMKVMRNDRDAFDHVIHAEEEMIKLCTGMARTEKSERVKALLNWFVDDEKQHLDEIEGIYDFVEAPHCYLEWGEFSNMRTL
jgi:rubrerythrin